MRRKIVKLLLFIPIIYIFILFLTSPSVFNYTLQPNKSMTIPVRTKHRHIEYYALLHFEKYDEGKLKLSSPGDAWYDRENEVSYNLDRQSIIVSTTEEEGWLAEISEKELNGISLAEDGIVVDFTGERVLGATESYDYTITITNVSSHPISFKAVIEHH